MTNPDNNEAQNAFWHQYRDVLLFAAGVCVGGAIALGAANWASKGQPDELAERQVAQLKQQTALMRQLNTHLGQPNKQLCQHAASQSTAAHALRRAELIATIYNRLPCKRAKEPCPFQASARARAAALVALLEAESAASKAGKARRRKHRPDLDGLVLADVRLPPLNFDSVSLVEAELRNVRFGNGSFVRTNFDKATLTGSSLSGATMHLASFVDADLSRAKLTAARMIGANFSNATLLGADFTGSQLEGVSAPGASFKGAVFKAARMKKVKLINADFTGAGLAKADLSHANLSGSDFSGADLKGARLTCVDLAGANLGTATGLTVAQVCTAKRWRSSVLPGDVARKTVSKKGTRWSMVRGGAFRSTALKSCPARPRCASPR